MNELRSRRNALWAYAAICRVVETLDAEYMRLYANSDEDDDGYGAALSNAHGDAITALEFISEAIDRALAELA